MLAAQGGGERETGRGPDAVVGQVIPANSVVFRRSPRPHHGVGHLIPDRSVELHRAVRSPRVGLLTTGGKNDAPHRG